MLTGLTVLKTVVLCSRKKATVGRTAILIPDSYDEYNYENWMKKNWRQIFEEELESWMLDTDYWPEKLTYKMFKQWFTVLVGDMVIDLGKEPIEMEEL